MGNSGSAHNISSGRSGIDRSSQFQSQFKHLSQNSHQYNQLSRTGFRTSPINSHRNINPHWRRSYQPPGIEREPKPQAEIPFKVLPELDKKLHLRATTNGAILNSGGTISGRKPNESIPNALTQRSKTFIVETGTEGNRKNDPHSEFTRSQTLLYVKTKTRDAETNLSRMQRHTYSEPELMNKLLNQQSQQKPIVMESPSRPSNRNKYSKKRRAPEAPAAVATSSTPITKKNTEILRSPNLNPNLKPDQVKPTHFAKNSDRHMKLTKPPLKPVPHQSDNFKRGNENRNSLGGNHLQSTAIETPKIIYRREKSSDAIMLKSRKSERLETCSPLKIPVNMEHHQKYDDHTNIPKTSPPKENPVEVIPAAPVNKTQRTFYFGMELVGSSDTSKTVTADDNLANDGAQLPNTANYDMEYKSPSTLEERMNDNGLLVHIRPTLPRRQAETPSFSPTLAWRSLMEELDRVEAAHMKENPSIWMGENPSSERPIQPHRTLQSRQVTRPSQVLNTWTPEQDLGDDNDDKIKGLGQDDDTSSDEYRSKCDGDGLLFYGSKMKATGPPAVTPIHTFSLSLPRDSHLQHNRGLGVNDVCIYKSLQKAKAEDYVNNNGSQWKSKAHPDQPKVSVTNFEGCNNWLLHKNVGGLDPNHTKSLEFGSKRQRLVSIEPQSIKFLTGGKHVMYLPGSNDPPNPIKPVQKEESQNEVVQSKPKSNRHFKSRQRLIPQSSQDKTPTFPVMSIREHSFKLEEEKPLHQRFSFNNPVRLLEKKFHTDKTVKAAKTKMSWESELEALKKVEEDFQRNRANEKENIQHQLRMHFGNDTEHFEQYHSLPIAPVLDRFAAISLNDSSKLYCRDDPEGCVSNVPYTVNESEEHSTNFATKIF